MLISAITLCPPRRLASIADRMFASSALVTATNTSALSMFSSSSSSSSAASPCQHDGVAELLGDAPRAALVALDELDLVLALQALRETEADVAAARDHDLAHRVLELPHLLHHQPDVVARGDEEHLVAFLDDRVAVGLMLWPSR